MKKILIAGAGKSTIFLIEYLLKYAEENRCHITVADAVLQNAIDKTQNSPFANAVELNVHDADKRQLLVKSCDIVISMLPPVLHIKIAEDCLQFGKHLLTASYLDDGIKKMEKSICEKKLLFLYEMGLDPGIDHMSAMQALHCIKKEGGEIISFKSHCGGLTAPQCDNNPWHYKISWNPANVVRAGKAGAIFKENGSIKELDYNNLFSVDNKIIINGDHYAFYANRDSLAYMELYDLHNVQTFMRTTLRHPDFIKGWKNIIALKLTDETKKYQTNDLSPYSFFKKHLQENKLEHALPDNTLELEQLAFLGFYDDSFFINKGFATACDVLQLLLEKNLALAPTDTDMIVMLHEIIYTKNNFNYEHKSILIVTGDDNKHTAMAKTVGLPLAIAAKKILEGEINIHGLHIPIIPAIYKPVMHELANYGIKFVEDLKTINNIDAI